MAKTKKTIHVRIPEYGYPPLKWRRVLQKRVREKQQTLGIEYTGSDRLEIVVRLYLRKRALVKHDLDNRLKDILDALQGRTGGPKRIRPQNPIIPNDNQIFRIVAEKAAPPRQSRGDGHLTIRKLTHRRRG